MLRQAAIAGLSLASAVKASQYTIDTQYTPSDLDDASKWVPFTATDPTSGYVTYVDDSTASSLGLKGVGNDGTFYMKPDTGDASTSGRKSVRIESAKTWKHALIVGKFAYLPKPACGAWPAFWTNGIGEWPQSGELDIYESWNEEPFNRPAFHTGSKDQVGGSLILSQSDFSANLTRADCDTTTDTTRVGCAAQDWGSPYGSSSGGVYAALLAEDEVAFWRWTLDAAPVDLDTAHPDPSAWGEASLRTSPSAGNLDNFFKEQQIIINLDFCGGAPEATWSTSFFGADSCATKTGASTCQEWVKANGDYFADTYFKIDGVTVWTLQNATNTTTSTTSSSSSTTSTSLSSSSTGVSTTAATTTATTSSHSGYNATTTAGPTATYTGDEGCDDETTETAGPTATDTGDEGCDDEPTETTTPAYSNSTTTGSAAAVTTSAASYTTSTIYVTSVETITSCPVTVTNCPVGSVTTKTLVSTVVVPCDTTETSTPAGNNGSSGNQGGSSPSKSKTSSPAQTTAGSSGNQGSSGETGVTYATKTATVAPVQTSTGSSGSSGSGGDQGSHQGGSSSVKLQSTLTMPLYSSSTAASYGNGTHGHTAAGTGTTLSMHSTVSAGCLSGKCSTQTAAATTGTAVAVSGSDKLALGAGWVALLAAVLAL